MILYVRSFPYQKSRLSFAGWLVCSFAGPANAQTRKPANHQSARSAAFTLSSVVFKSFRKFLEHVENRRAVVAKSLQGFYRVSVVLISHVAVFAGRRAEEIRLLLRERFEFQKNFSAVFLPTPLMLWRIDASSSRTACIRRSLGTAQSSSPSLGPMPCMLMSSSKICGLLLREIRRGRDGLRGRRC